MAGCRSPVSRTSEPMLRLVPYTKQSMVRQEFKCLAHQDQNFHHRSGNKLPEYEAVCLAPGQNVPKRFFNMPLEDPGQCGLDKTFCVLVKRSSSFYLYRFSAEDSMFMWSPWSPIRRFAIKVSCHRFFELFVMTTILLNCVFLALTQPIEETEYVFLVIYTVEMLIKTVAKGFILNKYSYLRNPWNWLDFIVVLAGYVTLSLQAMGIAIGNLAGLRTFRVLRAFKTVSITPGLKTIVNAMLHSLKMLVEVMTLTVFCLMVFALLALQLFLGILRHKCVLNMSSGNASHSTYAAHVSNRSNWLLEGDGQIAVCGNRTGSRQCPANYTCLPDVGENPNFGFTNFDSYGYALLTTFQLITLDFWEDVYNKITAAVGPTSVFFFLLVVFFGSFYLINLTLAVVAIAYEEEAEATLNEQDKVKKFTTGLPEKFTSTLAALKIRTKFRNRASSSRWCTPRRGTPRFNQVHHISPEVSVRDVPVILSSSTFPPGAVASREPASRIEEPLREVSEQDPEVDEEACEVPHPMCIGGPAPDIVASTGGHLPSSITENRVFMDAPSSSGGQDNSNQNSELPGSSQQDIWATISAWCSLHMGYCCMNCGMYTGAVINRMRKLHKGLQRMVDSSLFETVITVFILLNTAFLSAEHHGMTPGIERVLRVGNLVFTIIFTMEACVKMLALGRRYFQSRWNVFDLIVVAVSLIDLSFETVGGLSVLRTFRLLRVVKLAHSWPTMRLLLAIIASTLGAVGNMTLVLAVIVYILAIMGVQLFSDVYTPENFAPDVLPRWNFTDFWHSLLMMFRILCGEWVEPLWDCMRVAGEKRQLCVALFLMALTVGNFLVLNLFLAMLLSSFNSKQLEEKREKDVPDSKLATAIRKFKQSVKRSRIIQKESLAKEAFTTTVQHVQIPPPPPPPTRRWSAPGTPTLGAQLLKINESSICRAPSTRDLPRNSSEQPPSTIDDARMKLVLSQTFRVVPSVEDKDNDYRNRDPPLCCPFCECSRCSEMESTSFCRYWTSSRKFALWIVDHKSFEWSILALIFASSVVLCFEDVHLSERPVLQTVLKYVNLVFTSLFVLEVLIKWMAYGLVVYFASLWTTMDFIIVCVSVVSVVVETSGSGLYALRAIRTLRALRPLRAISRWQGMKIVVNALMSAIPSIVNVFLVCLVFWLIFGIMGVQFFAGKFYRCVDSSGIILPREITPDHESCTRLNYTWVNSNINFDNVRNAYLALFQVATFEGWMEVMQCATDATEVGQQPYPEANFLAYIYFVTFIICGSFFTLNLFIGVIIDNFNMLKKKYEGGIVEMFLTDSQKTYYTAMLKLGKKKPRRIVSRPQNRYLRMCCDIVMSRKFELFVFFLIFLNMVAMTVEHYQQPPHVTVILEHLNIVFTALYGFEALFKIVGLRHHYFTYPWNIFDLCIFVISVGGIVFEEALEQMVISPTLLRVIRLVRIGRVLRLIKAAKGIRKLLFALIISLPALFNIGALLFLVTFVYAIIGMSIFAHVKVADGFSGGGLNEMVNFKTFASSMSLLFRLATSAGWNDVLSSLMVHPPDCDPEFKNLPNGNCGHPTVAIIYLVSYIIINFMVIINMYIAVILENLIQANKEDTGITEDDIEMFYLCWSQFDPNASQFIKYSQLSDFVASLDPPLQIDQPNAPALIAMNLPISSGDRIHCLDILHSLVSHVLGDVEDTEEFRVVQQQVDQRFRKTFPTRNQVEIISTTLKRKQIDNAAKLIQRAYRRHLDRKRKKRQQETNGT